MSHTHTHCRTDLSGDKNALIYAAAVTVLFGIVEALSGWWFGSLSLFSDAGHMAVDATALMLAAFASWIGRKPTTARHTYGFGRVEVIVSWISSFCLMILIANILIEAVGRLHHPHVVEGKAVIVVALIGLLINIVVAWILSKGEKTLNLKVALLHVLSDLLGSVAVLGSGIIIYFTKWNKIDPIFSIFICLLILISTIRLLGESLRVLMEGVPANLNINDIELTMQQVPGVYRVHDLHVWTLSSGVILLTAHVVITEPKYWPKIIDNLRDTIQNNFGISHVTLQVENTDSMSLCVDCRTVNK